MLRKSVLVPSPLGPPLTNRRLDGIGCFSVCAACTWFIIFLNNLFYSICALYFWKLPPFLCKWINKALHWVPSHIFFHNLAGQIVNTEALFLMQITLKVNDKATHLIPVTTQCVVLGELFTDIHTVPSSYSAVFSFSPSKSSSYFKIQFNFHVLRQHSSTSPSHGSC